MASSQRILQSLSAIVPQISYLLKSYMQSPEDILYCAPNYSGVASRAKYNAIAPIPRTPIILPKNDCNRVPDPHSKPAEQLPLLCRHPDDRSARGDRDLRRSPCKPGVFSYLAAFLRSSQRNVDFSLSILGSQGYPVYPKDHGALDHLRCLLRFNLRPSFPVHSRSDHAHLHP